MPDPISSQSPLKGLSALENESPSVTPPPAPKPNDTPPIKRVYDAVCAVTSDRAALELARRYEMARGGLAQKQLTHFLSGKGTPLTVPLARMLAGDATMRACVIERVTAEISRQVAMGKRGTEISGFVFISQGDYSNSDNQLALGGTYVWFTIDGSADGRAANQQTGELRVNLHLADRYFFSPHDNRVTQCFHQAGERLVQAGTAKEFDQVGDATLSLHLRDEAVFITSGDESFTQVPDAMRDTQTVAPLQVSR